MPSPNDEQDLPIQDPAELAAPQEPEQAPAEEAAPTPEPAAPAEEEAQPESHDAAIAAGLAAAAGEDDVDDDGVPKGLSPRARERVHELVKARQEAAEAAAALKAQVEAFMPIVEQHRQLTLGAKELGITEDQWREFFEFESLLMTGTPEATRQAMQLLDARRRELAEQLASQGVEVEGVDLLDGFPELKARVDGYELTREDAIKLARVEMMDRQRSAPRAPPQSPPPAQPAPGQLPPAGTGQRIKLELDALGAELEALDPMDYKPIMDHLIQSGVALRILQTAPPEHIAPFLKQAYWNYKREAMARVRQTAKRQHPIPSTPQGGVGHGTPTTHKEALSEGLESVLAKHQ